MINIFNNKNYEELIEYILYERDRNPEKDRGHVFGLTTIFSYSRWNRNYKDLEKYEKYLDINFKTEDIFIQMINEWYDGNFERNILEIYTDIFEYNYLYNFIIGVSYEKDKTKLPNFLFSEKIDIKGLKFLLKSYKQNSNYLFSNIALGSYYQHNQKFDLAYKFYIKALSLDKDNPWVLAKLAILYSSMGLGKKGLLKAEDTMKKVVSLLSEIPWTNAWYGETLNMIGKYFDALKYFQKYEELTDGKHRTFEPFMRKAESYIGLGDFKKARKELDKESQYYFGEGYRFVYNDLDKKLNNLGY